MDLHCDLDLEHISPQLFLSLKVKHACKHTHTHALTHHPLGHTHITPNIVTHTHTHTHTKKPL